MPTPSDPHGSQPVVEAGAPLDRTHAAILLVHGRGATAESILSLADAFAGPDVARLAPQAAGNTWYPYSFLAPIAQNEPHLGSALAAVEAAYQRIEAAGIPSHRTMLVGFSQGACLALEYAARHPRRYGAVAGLSGGLIGTGPGEAVPPPGDKRFDYAGSLDGTPVFLGCSDVDAHIPVGRVHLTTDVFRRLGADVTERIYPGMGHTVSPDEIKFLRTLLDGILSSAA